MHPADATRSPSRRRGSFRRGRRALLLAAATALSTALSGCLFMPNDGTPIALDRRAGHFWSGEGMLVEVSPDRQRCKVYVRNRAGIVEGHWYDCRHVHRRVVRD